MLNPTQLAQFKSAGSPSGANNTTDLTDDAAYQQWKSSVSTNTAQPSPTSDAGGFGPVARSIGDSFNTRADNVGQIENSSANPASKVLQIGGQGAGVVNDVAGDAIKSVIKPEVMKAAGDTLSPIIDAAKNSPVGQHILNWWAELEQSHPEAAKNLEATGNIASLLSNAVGAGAAKEGAVAGTDAAISATKDAVAPLADKAASAVQSAKDTVSDAANSAASAVKGKTQNTFQDVYNAHAQSSKPLSNAFQANTIAKDGKTITPVDTMEGYTAEPKVSSNTKGSHVLDFGDVKAEATANSKAASKVVDQKAATITATLPKKEVLSDALDAAAADKEITRTASLPSVQSQIKTIFNDYGVKGSKLNATQINEFRKGANSASQAYYNAQKVAATAGAIPKDVADRAQAFAVLGDVFREKLIKLDPSMDAALTEQRTHNAVQQYASRAHLSSVGLPGPTRAMVDAGSAGAGALVGSTLGPVGTAVGAGVGVGLSEKAQAMLLRRTYEKTVKQSKP